MDHPILQILRRTTLILSALVGACVHPGVSSPDTAPSRAMRLGHLTAARRQFGQATSAGDMHEVEPLLAESVTVHFPGDSLRGRADVATYLVSPSGPVAFTAAPTYTDECGGVARDVGTILTRDQRVVSYALDWAPGPEGAVVSEIEIGPAGTDLTRLRRNCEGHMVQDYARRPTGLTVFISPASQSRSLAATALRDQMDRLGWNASFTCAAPHTPIPIPPPCEGVQNFSRTDNKGTGVLVGLTAHMWRRLGVELDGTSFPASTVLGHYSGGTYDADATHKGWFVSALATAEWEYLRLGLGPAAIHDTWSWGQNESGGFYGVPSLHVDDWSSNGVGAIGLVALSRPVTTHVAIELRWEHAWLGKQDLHAFRDFPAVRITRDYQVVGFGIEARF